MSEMLDLLTDRPVAYHPVLAKAFGGVKSGVFLSQLLYWMPRGRIEGWVYKTQTDFEEETGLTRREQETARRHLRDAGVLFEELRGVPATLHYRVDRNALEACLSGLAESADPVRTKPPDQFGGKRQTISEITTERAPSQESLVPDPDKRVWPDWYAALYSIPGFRFPLDHCKEWLDRKGVSEKLAEQKAYALKGKWPGTKSRPYTDAWATFQNWVSLGLDDQAAAVAPSVNGRPKFDLDTEDGRYAASMWEQQRARR
jgi:hypothetical protein